MTERKPGTSRLVYDKNLQAITREGGVIMSEVELSAELERALRLGAPYGPHPLRDMANHMARVVSGLMRSGALKL